MPSAAKAGSKRQLLNAGLKARTTRADFDIRQQPVKSLRENIYRPYGTRINFPVYPAFRLRLHAGLDCFAPAGLVRE